MAISIPHDSAGQGRRALTPNAALRYAWYWYISLLFVPFLLFLTAMWVLSEHPDRVTSHATRSAWFISAIAFMVVASPIAFVVRSRLFRSYWRGQGVSPRAYLAGMLVVWLTFEIGGIISLVGCIMSSALAPCILPALAAFMFFTPLWPNGQAMARSAGNTDDPEIYEEPR